MVTKEHLDKATNELIKFLMDMCEEICDGDADCLRKCRGQGLSEVGHFISKIDVTRTTPDMLREMVVDFKTKRMKRHYR